MIALGSTTSFSAAASTSSKIRSPSTKCPRLAESDNGGRKGAAERLGDSHSFRNLKSTRSLSLLPGFTRLFALLILSLFIVGTVAFEAQDGNGIGYRDLNGGIVERGILVARETTSTTRDSSSSSLEPSRTSTTASVTATESLVNGISVTATSTADLTLPTPFDTVSLTTNFTAASCPAFFTSFLSNEDLKACLPLSLLLISSNSFFQITKRSAFTITRVIDATCNVPNYNTCADIMETLGRNIKLDEHCGSDYQAQNPLVMEAYTAFISYTQVYAAGCEKSDTGSYCYVDAVTNTTNISDTYPYYLPLGTQLPAGAIPACSSCLQNVMDIFAGSAGNSTLPLYQTYIPAAEQINIVCGPSFVLDNVEMLSAASTSLTRPRTVIAFVVAAVVALVL
ncbi:hypothetical protein RUND412_006365 [Rhizina undulata]